MSVINVVHLGKPKDERRFAKMEFGVPVVVDVYGSELVFGVTAKCTTECEKCALSCNIWACDELNDSIRRYMKKGKITLHRYNLHPAVIMKKSKWWK